ncbi:MAG: GDSL-type esterase/lipase family protein [Minisyncoccia bacterium]
MKGKILGVVLVACVLLVGAWWLWGGRGEITNYPPREGPIVAFGDSLIYGIGATSGNDLVSRLSAAIGEPIENMGVSGNTTALGLARLDAVLEKEPSIVLLLLGGNDYLQRVPRETTFAQLGTIIERLQEKGAVVVLLGVRGGVLRDSFSDEFEKLADTYGTAFVPNVLDDILGKPALMFDQIHPNDAGYARIAEKVLPVLEGVIE